jgi:dTDP-4-amino-4,6-dideoxygalactose transaminase
VPVLEDAAQAAGARTPAGRPGALGTAATFSFFPSKNLGAFGDGGAITTSDPAIAERVRSLRFHGSRDKEAFDALGYNSRLDELQAAVLRVQLPHLDRWSEGRRAGAAAYAAQGLGELVALPGTRAGAEPAWHLYVIRHDDADALALGLNERGIAARAYYRTPLHRQPALRDYAPGRELPGTDEASRTGLAIPISPVLSSEQASEVVAGVRAVLG